MLDCNTVNAKYKQNKNSELTDDVADSDRGTQVSRLKRLANTVADMMTGMQCPAVPLARWNVF